MTTEHAEAFEYDTIGERAVNLAHQLAGFRARSGDELAALGSDAGTVLLSELTEAIALGTAAISLAMLATGRAVARAADNGVQPALSAGA